ncbi:unnamed protein product [Agarophyton chilense]
MTQTTTVGDGDGDGQQIFTLIVVGAGRWGSRVIATAGALRMRVAVVDSDAEALRASRRNAIAERDCKFFSSLDDALRVEAGAAVVVATPPRTHFALARRAIHAGRSVLVEKPLCDALEDAQRLAALADERGVVLMVDHLLHYSAAHRRMLALVRGGVVGRVRRVTMCRRNFGTVRTEENVLWSLAPHDVSILLAICSDAAVRSVSCTGHRIGDAQPVEDCVCVRVRFDDGVEAHLDANWMHPFKERRCVVYGAKGCVVLDEAAPGGPRLQAFSWSAKRAKPDGDVNIEKRQLTEAHITAALLHGDAEHERDQLADLQQCAPLEAALLHFTQCVRHGQKARTDGREGVRVVEVLTAATESLRRRGETVRMAECVAKALKKTHQNKEGHDAVMVHETAVVDHGAELGGGTKVWHFSHVMAGARLGTRCNIGQNVFIGGAARLGANVKVQNNVSVYDGVSIDDDVFLGPSCVLTNVRTPRSHVNRRHALWRTRIARGVTVGANATIVCGVSLGAFCFVAAGAVVTRNVPPHALVIGNPARIRGWVGKHGAPLKLVRRLSCPAGAQLLRCPDTQQLYTLLPAEADADKADGGNGDDGDRISSAAAGRLELGDLSERDRTAGAAVAAGAHRQQ